MKPTPRGNFLTSSLSHFLTFSAYILTFSAMAMVLCASPLAQTRPKAVPALRVYVLDCGTLKERDGVPYGLSHEQVPPRDLSDLCALIVHPRGTLLWETGLNEAVNRIPAGAPAGVLR